VSSSSSPSLGANLVLLGSVFLALQNVILRIVFVSSPIFGQGSVGGWLKPGFSNALLLLWLRTLLMTVLLVAIAPRLYPAVWTDLKRLTQQHRLLSWSVLSGVLLAIALTLLNLSISQVETGIAIGVFFTHPAWTVLLAWWVWGDRPTRLRLWLMVGILGGVLLTTFPPLNGNSWPLLKGGGVAIAAAGVYSAYSLTTQVCLRPRQSEKSSPYMHPVPFSLINFLITVVFTSFGLVGRSLQEFEATGQELFTAGLAAAAAALLAYVLLNFGVSMVGAALANLVSAVTPVLSAIFAWIFLGETLRLWQCAGVLLVAIGVGLLGWSMRAKLPIPKSK